MARWSRQLASTACTWSFLLLLKKAVNEDENGDDKQDDERQDEVSLSVTIAPQQRRKFEESIDHSHKSTRFAAGEQRLGAPPCSFYLFLAPAAAPFC